MRSSRPLPDGQNPLREEGEALIRQILEAQDLAAAKAAAEKLRALSKPFLDWAGKAERLSFDVATLPLFSQERLSTRAILETFRAHKRDRQLDLFGNRGPPHPRAGAAGPRAPERLGEPDDPGRLAGRHEFAAPLRVVGRAGADDLHGPAL
ncbi:MAG: hypothetical protein ACREV3_03825 [Gammaproteobacteria bacterium]